VTGEIIHQDAVELLKSLGDSSVPMIFADPPYGVGYHSNYYKGRNPHAPVANDWDFRISDFLVQAARVMADGSALYLCCRWDVWPFWVTQLPASLKLKTVIAWVKDNWSAGDLNGSFGNQWEAVLFITKGRHLLRGTRWPNVWNFPRVPHRKMLHPTQKPVGLVERAIQASTDQGDLVVDPFAGAGTTAVAALALGRQYFLGDIDPKMVRVCKRRLGLPGGEEPMAERDVPVEYGEQAEHQFGAPADDLATIAAFLREQAC
jgi:site-specific DNA-methyltransferase (adenine-specific)